MQNSISKLKVFTQTRPNRARALYILVALLAVLLIAAALLSTKPDKTTPTKHGTTTHQPIPTAQVTITKDGFVPATLSVKQGTKVSWTNTDTASHQIQANPHPTGASLPGLKSPTLNNKQTYEYTFTKPGSIHYHDHLNPTTNGMIDVKE